MRNPEYGCLLGELPADRRWAPFLGAIFVTFIIMLTVTSTSAKENSYKPIMTQALGQSAIQPFAYIGSQAEWISDVQLDGQQGNVNAHVAVDLIARLGLRFHTMTALDPAVLALQVEGDVPTGTLTPPLPFPNQDMPHSTPLGFRLRRAGLKVGYRDTIHVSAGVSTPSWGLGLVYNDGETRWQPGQLHLATPRDGDRALRALVGTGQLTPAKLRVGLGWEMPLAPGEFVDIQSIHNSLLSTTLEPFDIGEIGLLMTMRLGSERERLGLGYWLIDAFAKLRFTFGAHHLAVAMEMAIEGGDESDPLTGDLRIAGILRTQYGGQNWGVGIDTIFSSHGADDKPGFRIDRRLPFGWLMFPYVGRIHQSNLAMATQVDNGSMGAIENTLGGQLKGRWRPMHNLEVIGGVIFAMRPTGIGALEDWSTLGTEFNLSIRWKGMLSSTECILGLDGGLVYPATFLTTNEPIYGSRFILEYRL